MSKFKKKNIIISISCLFIAFIIVIFISYKIQKVKYNKLLAKRNTCEVTLDEIISKANSIKASSEIEIDKLIILKNILLNPHWKQNLIDSIREEKLSVIYSISGSANIIENIANKYIKYL